MYFFTEDISNFLQYFIFYFYTYIYNLFTFVVIYVSAHHIEHYISILRLRVKNLDFLYIFYFFFICAVDIPEKAPRIESDVNAG